MEIRNLRKVRRSIVISSKVDKAIAVIAKFKKEHLIYDRFVQKTEKYHARDKKNEANVGDTILIMETRLPSRIRGWRLVQIVEKAK